MEEARLAPDDFDLDEEVEQYFEDVNHYFFHDGVSDVRHHYTRICYNIKELIMERETRIMIMGIPIIMDYDTEDDGQPPSWRVSASTDVDNLIILLDCLLRQQLHQHISQEIQQAIFWHDQQRAEDEAGTYRANLPGARTIDLDEDIPF